jgi:hypothetical protein
MTNPNTNGWTDDVLIREIRAGSSRRNKAWEYIYKAWRGYYLKPILELRGTAEEADEVMSQVIVNLDKQIQKPDFELHSSKLSSFFTECLIRAWSKAAKRLALGTWWRSNRKSISRDSTTAWSSNIWPRKSSSGWRAMLNFLGEKCKKVLLLFGKGYSMREIADELGYVNEQTAKNVKGNCHRKLVELAKKDL